MDLEGKQILGTYSIKSQVDSSEQTEYVGTIDDVLDEAVKLKNSKLPGVEFTIKWRSANNFNPD